MCMTPNDEIASAHAETVTGVFLPVTRYLRMLCGQVK